MTRFVDLDGCLALYDGWRGYHHIGEPIPEMVRKVKGWLAYGDTVVIFTARIGNPVTPDTYINTNEAIRLVQDWTEKHLGQRLKVTNVKAGFDIGYDDKIHSIVQNTGLTVEEHITEELDSLTDIYYSSDALAIINHLKVYLRKLTDARTATRNT